MNDKTATGQVNVEKDELLKTTGERTSDFVFNPKAEEIHIGQQTRIVKAATEMQEAKEKGLHSTRVISIVTKRKEIYFTNLGDMHIPEGNMLELIETIIELAKVPGMLIGIGGDILNNAIKNSVSYSHGEVIDTQMAVESFTTALKARAAEEGINLRDSIAYIRSGNHENRSLEAGLDAAWMFAKGIDLTDRYAKNIARVEISVVKGDNSPLTKFVIEPEHGSKAPSKPGAQADDALSGKKNPGADLVIREHNHQKMSASETKSFRYPNLAKPYVQNIHYWNTGAHIPGGEYADFAGFKWPATFDKEVARLTVHDNGDKQIDFLNLRSIISKIERDKLKIFEENIKKLEAKKFVTRNEIKKEYLKLAKKITNQTFKAVKAEEQARDTMLKRTGHTDKNYLSILSGYMVGEDSNEISKSEITEREEKIKKDIEVLSKLNGSARVVLNGNMVFYKKAFTISNKNGNMLGEKFPEESFAYLEILAKMLMPIKDKIVAWNSGEQEDKIMKYQSEALAKMAMNRLQMPEKLCFEPYDKTRIHAEQLKIQSQQVEAYNKGMLAKALEPALKNADSAIISSMPYFIENFNLMTEEEQYALTQQIIQKYHSLPIGVDYNEKGKPVKNPSKNLKLDFLKDIISSKLRAEGEFLNLSEDQDYINFKFPIQEVELRQPHKDLIPNILFTMLGVDAKKVAINSNPQETIYFTSKIKDEKGKTRIVEFEGGFFKSKSGRGGIENKLRKGQTVSPGTHVYFTTSKTGREFVILDKQTLTNPLTGEYAAKDAIFISGGSYSKESGQTTTPLNKIYRISVRSNSQKNDQFATGIYDNAEDSMKVFCESLNYDTVLNNNSVLFEYMKNSVMRSYLKTVNEFEKETEEKKKQKDRYLFDCALDPIEKTAGKASKPKPRTKISKTGNHDHE